MINARIISMYKVHEGEGHVADGWVAIVDFSGYGTAKWFGKSQVEIIRLLRETFGSVTISGGDVDKELT